MKILLSLWSWVWTALLSVLLSVFLVIAQVNAMMDTKVMSIKEQQDMINKIEKLLRGNYIYPEKTDDYIKYLQQRLDQGVYSKLLSKHDVAKQLTHDLYEASQDLHFSVMYDRGLVQSLRNIDNEHKLDDLREQDRKASIANNHNFMAVQILAGNVGYMRFDYFADPEFAHDIVAASMKFVANTDALIIDLRNNNGGHMELSQLLMSYLFRYEDDKPLYDYYYNDDGKTLARKMWLLPSVSEQKYLDKPVYILTSSFTFSAAEWMAYVLKNRNRAVVVGEVTAGGAHPVGAKVINDDLVINIPIGEVKDPLTDTDFEGEGITPDVEAYFSEALHTAHKIALENLQKQYPKNSKDYAWHIEKLETLTNPVQLSDELLSLYQGEFGVRKIWKKEGNLYYNWKNKGRFRLIPMSKTQFMFEGLDDFRFEMIIEDGVFTQLKRIDKDGSSRLYQRN